MSPRRPEQERKRGIRNTFVIVGGLVLCVVLMGLGMSLALRITGAGEFMPKYHGLEGDSPARLWGPSVNSKLTLMM